MATHVVDDDINSLDIDTTTKDVGGDEDTLLEVLEHLVSVDPAMAIIEFEFSYRYACPSKACFDLPLSLVKSRVDGDTGEVALPQESVQLGGPCYRFDEDTDLADKT